MISIWEYLLTNADSFLGSSFLSVMSLIALWNKRVHIILLKRGRGTVLPPNSRPPNSLSSQIHGFISISIKLLIHGFIRKILLIHGFIRKNPSNSLFFLIILQWIGREFVNYEFTDFQFTENSWSQKTWIGRSHCSIHIHFYLGRYIASTD